MVSTVESAPLAFEAPGPGSWTVDAAHFPRPVSRFQAEIHPAGINKGFMECSRRYGVLIDTLDYRFVNGFAYSIVVPAPAGEIPARFEAAATVFQNGIWRDDLARWDGDVKPSSIRIHQDLLAVDPDDLSDDALAAYVDRCRENLESMIYQHHSFNLAALIPVGDFMAHVRGWTDEPMGAFLALTRGSAPESAGTFPELDQLADAIRTSPEALEILGNSDAGTGVLDWLCAQPDRLGEAAKAYLAVVGHRLLNSLDTGDPSAIEVPDALVSRIRLAVDQTGHSDAVVSEDEVSRQREKIPAEHHAQFDELLGEVRLMSRLRDERGFYSDVWAGGVMRRALLAAGARLVAEGRIDEAAHLVEATYDEIRALLNRTGGPSAADLAQHALYRKRHRVADVPSELGDPPSPPPAMDGLPPHVARIMMAMGTAVGSLGAGAKTDGDSTIVKGIGASPGTYSGTARVIDGPDDLRRLERGDVLVTAATTDSFNIVLPLLGAIVTNGGGLLSHAAIVGREYGIPSVVGTRNATAVIADGSRVTVNGTTGEVRTETA